MFELFSGMAKRVFGDANEREIRRMQPLVARINALEPDWMKLSDDDLRGKTPAFRERLERGASLDDLLPEAFATVREASRRRMGMRHYDCQLIGGIVLHQGRIAEMKTGEGKTLVATSPVYLNALAGKGVHVVTVNDYLAQRDADWMSPIYTFLGMTVGTILQGERSDRVKRAAYAADITYGTNNEFGFDYLRDNMKYSQEQLVQRGHFFAIVDEVDSILIDEARTPLIISGATDASVDLYSVIDAVVPLLQVEVDFVLDEKAKSVNLTEDGIAKVEAKLGLDNLYDPRNMEVLHHVSQSLKAHHLFKRDRDYVVRDGKVVIVDEFTGRLMHGRRWSDGLHQAVEAKERVTVEQESQVYATITFQNLFRMYQKLGGMTGTADTEAAEFAEIYKLDTVVIPTNRPIQRKDHDDIIFKNQAMKFEAVARQIAECHSKGQPVLVGTTSVEKSERVSRLLTRAGIAHEVLNAKNHGREAMIVAQAGRLHAVTISTNMAGRGTDIKLGGNPEAMAKNEVDPARDPDGYAATLTRFESQCSAEADQVRAAGGLFIIGTERHESRRVDNQLRGRSGRQGDPGESRFYLSLEDDLLRIFGSDKITVWMERMGLKDDEPIEHRWMTGAVENAQRKVEAQNFNIRKNVLEYDDVMNYQRKGVYELRRRALAADGIREMVQASLEAIVQDIVEDYLPDGVHPEQWSIQPMRENLQRAFGLEWTEADEQLRDFSREEIRQRMLTEAKAKVAALAEALGEQVFLQVARGLLLEVTDSLWKDHLLALDRLRQGVGLRGYGQRNPLLEYKREALQMYLMMSAMRDEEVITRLLKTDLRIAQQAPAAGVRKAVGGEFRKASEMLAGIRPNSPAPLPEGALSPDAGAVAPVAVSAPPPPPPPVVLPPLETPPPEALQPPQPGAEARAVALRFGIRRNDPCPCNSGKKYKKCCYEPGADEAAAV